MKFYLDINTTKPNAKAIAIEVKNFLEVVPSQEVVENPIAADVIISLGGDGTILNSFKKFPDKNIFGINCGHLGYLVEATIDTFQSKLFNIIQDNYNIEHRMALEATVKDYGYLGEPVLNEFTLKHYDNGVLKFEIWVNGSYLASYKGDGIICATPTGSTAYAFSAGGSYIYPTIEAIELIPICPHSAMNRGIILPSDKKIEIITNDSCILLKDGQGCLENPHGMIVEISKSSQICKLIRVDNTSFMEKIKENLG